MHAGVAATLIDVNFTLTPLKPWNEENETVFQVKMKIDSTYDILCRLSKRVRNLKISLIMESRFSTCFSLVCAIMFFFLILEILQKQDLC